MNTNEASLLQRAINTSATANAKADVAVSELLTVHRDLESTEFQPVSQP